MESDGGVRQGHLVPSLQIRQERGEDRRACEELVREAFFNRYRPGCSEHLILHNIRNSPGFMPWHSLVAVYEGELIGQVLLSPAQLLPDPPPAEAAFTAPPSPAVIPSPVESQAGDAPGSAPPGRPKGVPLLALGPVCVLPAAAGRGVGSALMRAAIASAQEHGAGALFLTGDPHYYRRFGFQAASSWGIRLQGLGPAQEAPFFMALPLAPGALDGRPGVFRFSALFDTSPEELAAFDATFPPRKRLRLPGQLEG